MSIYAIGDVHLSLSNTKPMDIFNGWKDYVLRIEKNWRAVVTNNDTVVLCGDISWGMNINDCAKDFEFLHNLPGKKCIIKGNHDYWWTTIKKMNDFFKNNGWDDFEIIHNSCVEIGNYAICGSRGWFFDAEADEDKKILKREVNRIINSINCAKQKNLEPIVFLHYPPILSGKICDDIMDVLIQNKIKRCFYGHLHAHSIPYAFKGDYKGTNLQLISADSLAFAPYLVEKL